MFPRPKQESSTLRGAAFRLRVFLAIFVLVLTLPACTKPAPPENVLTTSYVRDSGCRECHERQFEEWSQSDHDLGMQHATTDSVLGDFNDASFEKSGITSRFFRRDGKFMVRTEGPEGEMADFEIAYTFGVRPLQQYLVPFPGGRLQCLTIAWDTQERRWFDLYPNDNFPHEDSMHWTGIQFNWNHMCAGCHSTNLQKNFDLETDTFTTAWSEIDVGCQACHGPGAEHVKWANDNASSGGNSDEGFGLAVDYVFKTGQFEVEQCAPCHSRRHDLSVPGSAPDAFMDTYVPSLLEAELYHADGQILDEVFVYGSFVQSKMYGKGVRCTDCHNPHTLKLVVAGNRLCTRCHQVAASDLYPSLKSKNYDDTTHHFHPPDNEGAQCVQCHMPVQNYMIVDPRHDHSMRIPRPDLTVSAGIPNACSACHSDKSTEWALDAIEKWYGPRDVDALDYATVLTLARQGRAPISELKRLVQSTELPAIKRATAMQALFPYGDTSGGYIEAGLLDPDPLIRLTAVRGAVLFPDAEKRKRLLPLLEDPVRSIRLESARVLSTVPPDTFPRAQRAAYDAALEDYVQVQHANGDRAESHTNLAMLHQNQNKPDAAEKAYLTAIEIDPYFLQAPYNLAVFYSTLGRNSDAERTLRNALKIASGEGELLYSLGLLLAEENRLGAAAAAMAEALEALPDRARIHYNYALVLQRLERRAEAERAFIRAVELDPTDPAPHYALAVYYVQNREWTVARKAALRLLELAPDDTQAQRLLAHINEQSRNP